jgi:hypothetical protein
MTRSRLSGVVLGILAVIALCMNWATIVYWSVQYDPGSTWLWRKTGDYVIWLYASVALAGTLLAIVAAIRSSKAWYIIALLNITSFLLEFCAS